MNSNLKINCKQATYLISKQQESKISLIDRLKLVLHLRICACCKLFNKQINQFTNMLKTKPQKNILLSNSKKQIMKEKMQEVMESEQN